MVTLRGDRMYEFFDRLVNVALAARARFPRHALPRASTAAAITPWDRKDQLIFPEIDYAKVDKTKGMNI